MSEYQKYLGLGDRKIIQQWSIDYVYDGSGSLDEYIWDILFSPAGTTEINENNES